MIEFREITSKEDYEHFKNVEGKIGVLKYGASWCGPCRMLEQILHNLDQEKVKDAIFGEIDADTEEIEDILLENRIRNIPVLAFYRNGIEVDRLVGSIPANEIYNTLDKIRDVVVTDN